MLYVYAYGTYKASITRVRVRFLGGDESILGILCILSIVVLQAEIMMLMQQRRRFDLGYVRVTRRHKQTHTH